MLNFAISVSERLMTEDFCQMNSNILNQLYERRKIAGRIERYFAAFRSGYLNPGLIHDYYYAISKLLVQEEYERLALYFPFSDLKAAPQFFKDAYLRAWYNLLNYHDARENFFEGDIFELDARPDGKLERVVKGAHLAPWLLEAGYIEYSDIERILTLGKDDVILLQSFAETWRILDERRLLSKKQREALHEMTANIPVRKRLQPLYVSEKRKKWLQEKATGYSSPLVTPKANLAGPFSRNLDELKEGLEEIQSHLNPKEIVLVTGSRLRGYGTHDSDWDIFKLADLESEEAMRPGNPRTASLYFGAIWLGGSEVDNLAETAIEKASEYFGRGDRRRSIERLESDLLQYRLLHKGYQRFYPRYNSVAKNYPEIDGNCPFYDDGYRRIATELYAKYVFIPS